MKIYQLLALAASASARFRGIASFDYEDEDGVTIEGAIEFIQDPEGDCNTHVSWALETNQEDADWKWHIHQDAVSNDDCQSVGGHFDPLLVNQENNGTGDAYTPIEGFKGTYEVGDLAGKYGNLQGTSPRGEEADEFIVMYGEESILERSIVIHVGETKRACATIKQIELAYNPPSVEYKYTVFKGDIQGFIAFKRHYCSVQMWHWLRVPEGEHNYHIHSAEVDGSGDCASTDGHWDPHSQATFMEDERWEYGVEGARGTFEVGDLSGFYGAVDGQTWGKAYDTTIRWADLNNRSITVHNADGDRVACQNFRDFSFNRRPARRYRRTRD